LKFAGVSDARSSAPLKVTAISLVMAAAMFEFGWMLVSTTAGPCPTPLNRLAWSGVSHSRKIELALLPVPVS
jgi:hypothetical protein